jgi:hypothetical protein
MKKPIYVCSKCPKTFPRRWNAERHGNSVHKGLSKIVAQLGNDIKTTNSFRDYGNPTSNYPIAPKDKKFDTYAYKEMVTVHLSNWLGIL